MKFKFPKINHEHKFTPVEYEAFRIKDRVSVVEWAEENFRLTKAYVNPGRFTALPWQREPLNALNHYNCIYYMAPVQTGKSVLAEVCVGYSIDNYSLNGMLVYANEKTVRKVFKYRIRPAIENIPALRKYWSGKDDDLTISNLELRNCIWGVASAENKNDLASFPAGFVCMSEVSKYRLKDFDPIAMARGRQQAYLSRGLYKRILESSPYDTGDIFYNEIYVPGTLFLQPYCPCPHCGKYQVLTDSQIKEVDAEGAHAHSPDWLRRKKEASVRYECLFCSLQITEDHRPGMLEKVVWAAPEIDEGNLHQDAEEITPRGKVLEHDREEYEAVCYNWNRLVDISYKFHECLARFFESRKSPEKFRVYQNEDMARFHKIKRDRLDENALLKKKLKYTQIKEGVFVPEGVLVIVLGMDTQDSGFYYTIRGFGKNMETWLLRHDFIECSTKRERYKDKENILKLFRKEVSSIPLVRADGIHMAVKLGFIDRGGHRPDDVDYLCNNVPWLKGYIGSTVINPKNPLLKRSDKYAFYLGQTQLFAEQVAQYMETDLWHLPEDTGAEYLKQVVAQYGVELKDKHGQISTKWVCENDDHYRDCENYSFAAAHFLQLERHLFSEEGCMLVDNANSTVPKPMSAAPAEKKKPETRTDGWNSRRRWSR